jgi:hypothetical protein
MPGAAASEIDIGQQGGLRTKQTGVYISQLLQSAGATLDLQLINGMMLTLP